MGGQKSLTWTAWDPQLYGMLFSTYAITRELKHHCMLLTAPTHLRLRRHLELLSNPLVFNSIHFFEENIQCQMSNLDKNTFDTIYPLKDFKSSPQN